jgi:four helix bundle protein
MHHNFEKLEIWKESRKLVKVIYLLSKQFPADEKFGLTSQIRRAAISVPSNIAEGCGRGTNAQLSHFLDIAIGSLCEMESQIFLALDLAFISKEELQNTRQEIIHIRKMTIRFKKSIKN